MSNADITERIKRISGSDPRKCMKCGKCSGACPAYDSMDYHPHQFVDMLENGRVEELLNSRGIYHCFTCMACVERCPRNVRPAEIIGAVRAEFLRRQGNCELKAEQIQETAEQEIPGQLLAAAFRRYKK